MADVVWCKTKVSTVVGIKVHSLLKFVAHAAE